MINLGDRVQDVISGIKGIVVAKTQWLFGCNRITIEPEGNDNGKIFERVTIDEPQAELLATRIFTPDPKQVMYNPAGDRGDERFLKH